MPFRPLVPHEDKGIGPEALDGNLIIHGDNLHALKALLNPPDGKRFKLAMKLLLRYGPSSRHAGENRQPVHK